MIAMTTSSSTSVKADGRQQLTHHCGPGRTPAGVLRCGSVVIALQAFMGIRKTRSWDGLQAAAKHSRSQIF
jgi:hypothetical protein